MLYYAREVTGNIRNSNSYSQTDFYFAVDLLIAFFSICFALIFVPVFLVKIRVYNILILGLH